MLKVIFQIDGVMRLDRNLNLEKGKKKNRVLEIVSKWVV